MNNPFDYEPSEEMLRAQRQLIEHIESLCRDCPDFANDVGQGKMFGILLSEEETLFAFSGQIGGRFEWPGFVPAVYDYLDETGYFKTHEREISRLNQRIAEAENSPELKTLNEQLKTVDEESRADIERYKELMRAAKAERDIIRGKGVTNESDLIRESQYMKAELHRKRLMWKDRREAVEKKINGFIGEIRSMKLARQHQSDSLQQWLFNQFVFTIHDGSQKRLTEIFSDYLLRSHSSLPRRLQNFAAAIPSGSGECCEPKLLHHAFSHQLQPREIGMFWWGASPKQEIRRHLQFYPACNGKCRPILEAMLPEFPHADDNTFEENLPIIYEDDDLLVVNKPAGLLSVPGKRQRPSVISLLKAQQNKNNGFIAVHRLDMDTSGILLVAKNETAYKHLQRQFAEHSIEKEYVAMLEHLPLRAAESPEGRITLPLAPDYSDRPRQKVDFINGKKAVTCYSVSVTKSGEALVRLKPLTGRTHQLRIHCAHKDGLDCPIKGDPLYGKKDTRLFLHAATLAFTHPGTKERITIHADAPFLAE